MMSPKPVEEAFRIAEEERAPQRTRRRSVVVCSQGELPLGSRKIVSVDGISIGVFHLPKGIYAVRNYCPHQGAPLCRGSLHGTYRPAGAAAYEPALEGRVLRCPWHGWEFDVVTGKGLFDARTRVAVYEVEVSETGEIRLFL